MGRSSSNHSRSSSFDGFTTTANTALLGRSTNDINDINDTAVRSSTATITTTGNTRSRAVTFGSFGAAVEPVHVTTDNSHIYSSRVTSQAALPSTSSHSSVLPLSFAPEFQSTFATCNSRSSSSSSTEAYPAARHQRYSKNNHHAYIIGSSSIHCPVNIDIERDSSPDSEATSENETDAQVCRPLMASTTDLSFTSRRESDVSSNGAANSAVTATTTTTTITTKAASTSNRAIDKHTDSFDAIVVDFEDNDVERLDPNGNKTACRTVNATSIDPLRQQHVLLLEDDLEVGYCCYYYYNRNKLFTNNNDVAS
jgi:hypothetical protein